MRSSPIERPKLYAALAPWFHLVTHPRSYAGEARFAAKMLGLRHKGPRSTLLELGSGGGNNAFHLKKLAELTLTDIAREMLRQSRRINPTCEHILGDMRSLRLKRQFDVVFVHDAVMHMRSERDLKRAIATAFAHCKHGGIALFQPDFVRETFDLSTRRGGHSENGRQVRFVETQGPRGGSRTLVDVDFEFTLTNEKGRTRVARDRHVVGLFPRATWLKMLRAAGFRVRCVTDPWKRECFVCRVP